jgi:hypothetical protein
MITALFIGSVMVVATIVVEALMLGTAINALRHHSHRFAHLHLVSRTIVSLSSLSVWLLLGITIAVWLWGALFIVLGEFQSLNDALYFSIVTATTLGYGDIVLKDEWRLLSGMLAANGLFLFSLNTAFIFEVFRRILETEQSDQPT